MKRLTILMTAGLIALAGCGGADDSTDSPAKPAGAATADETAGDAAATNDDATAEQDATAEDNTPTDDAAAIAGSGTEIALGKSQFGDMLFDAKRQAIYIFEIDKKGESVCYDECAEAWPPVFTDGEPTAGKGVKGSLLGTTKRRDGKLQVTYDGKPLYYYAHEAPGEVKCHNINLNGGLWWVVGANGKRLA